VLGEVPGPQGKTNIGVEPQLKHAIAFKYDLRTTNNDDLRFTRRQHRLAIPRFTELLQSLF